MLVFHCNYPVTKEVVFSTKTSWQEHLRCTWRILETASQSSLDPFQPPESYFILNSALRVASTSLYLVREHDSACWSTLAFPGGSDSKASAYNEDPGSIPGLGRSPGEGNGNPLQYSSLEKSHGQRSLVGYSPSQRVRRDWATSRLPVTESSDFSTYRRFASAACVFVDMYMCTCKGKKGAGSERTECSFHVVRLLWKFTESPRLHLVKGMTSLLLVALSTRACLMPALW